MGLYWVPIQLYLGKCSHISDNILKRGRYIVTTERNTDKKRFIWGTNMSNRRKICLFLDKYSQIGDKYCYIGALPEVRNCFKKQILNKVLHNRNLIFFGAFV